MTFAEDIDNRAKNYQAINGYPPTYLILDTEKYALLMYELNSTIFEKKPKSEVKEFNGLKIVQANMFCEGRVRFGFGK